MGSRHLNKGLRTPALQKGSDLARPLAGAAALIEFWNRPTLSKPSLLLGITCLLIKIAENIIGVLPTRPFVSPLESMNPAIYFGPLISSLCSWKAETASGGQCAKCTLRIKMTTGHLCVCPNAQGLHGQSIHKCYAFQSLLCTQTAQSPPLRFPRANLRSLDDSGAKYSRLRLPGGSVITGGKLLQVKSARPHQLR